MHETIHEPLHKEGIASTVTHVLFTGICMLLHYPGMPPTCVEIPYLPVDRKSKVTGETIPAHQAFLVIPTEQCDYIDNTDRDYAKVGSYYIIYLKNDQLQLGAPAAAVRSQEDDRGVGAVDPPWLQSG